MVGLIGKKIGTTRVYDDAGNAVCVTVIHTGENRVVQRKTTDGKDGYNAVQIGYDDQSHKNRVTQPLQGHFKKHNAEATKWVKEFRDFSLEVQPGDTVPVTIFEPGDYVLVAPPRNDSDRSRPYAALLELTKLSLLNHAKFS